MLPILVLLVSLESLQVYVFIILPCCKACQKGFPLSYFSLSKQNKLLLGPSARPLGPQVLGPPFLPDLSVGLIWSLAEGLRGSSGLCPYLSPTCLTCRISWPVGRVKRMAVFGLEATLVIQFAASCLIQLILFGNQRRNNDVTREATCASRSPAP